MLIKIWANAVSHAQMQATKFYHKMNVVKQLNNEQATIFVCGSSVAVNSNTTQISQGAIHHSHSLQILSHDDYFPLFPLLFFNLRTSSSLQWKPDIFCCINYMANFVDSINDKTKIAPFKITRQQDRVHFYLPLSPHTFN